MKIKVYLFYMWFHCSVLSLNCIYKHNSTAHIEKACFGVFGLVQYHHQTACTDWSVLSLFLHNHTFYANRYFLAVSSVASIGADIWSYYFFYMRGWFSYSQILLLVYSYFWWLLTWNVESGNPKYNSVNGVFMSGYLVRYLPSKLCHYVYDFLQRRM